MMTWKVYEIIGPALVNKNSISKLVKMNTSNLKRINEYKRIISKILVEEGVPGLKLVGTTYSNQPLKIGLTIRAEMCINLTISEGTRVRVAIGFGKKQEVHYLDLAEPNSIGKLRQFVRLETNKMLKGSD